MPVMIDGLEVLTYQERLLWNFYWRTLGQPELEPLDHGEWLQMQLLLPPDELLPPEDVIEEYKRTITAINGN